MTRKGVAQLPPPGALEISVRGPLVPVRQELAEFSPDALVRPVLSASAWDAIRPLFARASEKKPSAKPAVRERFPSGLHLTPTDTKTRPRRCQCPVAAGRPGRGPPTGARALSPRRRCSASCRCNAARPSSPRPVQNFADSSCRSAALSCRVAAEMWRYGASVIWASAPFRQGTR
jgi:hypothetical protein